MIEEESVRETGSERGSGGGGLPVPDPERRVRRAALVVAVLTSFLGPFMGSSVNVALPSLGREFGMTPVALGWVIACLVFLGVGFALFSSPNTKAIMNAVEPRVYGVASAVVGTMRQVGMTLSMGAVMLILKAHLGDAEVDAATAGAFVAGMRTAFTIFAALCAVGILASLARGRGDGRAAG